jgi:NAD(P)-dependent dehydrogenase (short-subunit alcohol dehydrogenase family)
MGGWFTGEERWVPMRRLTTPADVGNVVALLCSEEAGFVTGKPFTRMTDAL